ncbi:hypothetical protein BHM03_00017439 [Ensete ventricosum]|nr:hypothetical protein BHM03_00017439 [Ensete ventricosum]
MEAKANATGTPLPPSKVSSSRNPNPGLSPSPTRLWRPAAQRNIRNQWSKLLSNKERWASAASEGRSQATSLVTNRLFIVGFIERFCFMIARYMPAMELGVLKDMPGIRQKACDKLTRKQEMYRKLLLSSYNDMVLAVAELVRSARSMRCFLKGPIASPLAQFSDIPEHENDPGDGGGIPVFSSFSITYFENLAHELVEMFVSELSLKVLIIFLKLHSSSFPVACISF